MVGTRSKGKFKIGGEGRYGRFKSKKSLRQKFVKIPGGKTTVHYVKKKPKKHHCGNCGAVLKGMPRERSYKMQNMPKSKKRPERPYAGNLCTKCLRALMIKKARNEK